MPKPRLKDSRLAAQLIADDLVRMHARKQELATQREQVNQQIDDELAQLDALIAKWQPTLKQEG